MQYKRSHNVLAATGLAVCLVALTPPVATADVSWPGLRGPQYNGTAPEGSLFEGEDGSLELGWKRELGSGYSSVVIGDGRVVTMFASGDADYIAAFDTDSGDELWRYRIGDTYGGHDGSHDGPISTPVLAEDRVYGLGAWGHLFALDVESGNAVWTTHLVDDHGGQKPHYGFATSPVLTNSVLVVEMGGGEGKTIAGFDAATGELRWSLGDEAIHYHSPVVATIAETPQVLAAGTKTLYGLEPASGEVLWSHEHGGDEHPMGGATIVPVPAGEGRVMMTYKGDASTMIRVHKSAEGYGVEELWSNNAIRNSYVIPVAHDGVVYGMANRIFTAVDAESGEVLWRSREPGDGFPTVVGDHLVVITKPGTLHIANASREGYQEIAQMDLFDEHSWSTVGFADGALFARSMASIARIDSGAGSGDESGASWVASTDFGNFLAAVDAAEDKAAVVDEYLETATYPVVEPSGAVHFLYRGEAEDVGIVGDMIGFRRQDPMTRVPGTDLFYYSTRLEPNAAVSYGFLPDFGEEAVADPNNARIGKGLFGEVSFFGMPAWQDPDYYGEVADERRGQLETFEWESEAQGETRKASVYLPAGYAEDTDRRYPVVYVHGGKEAIEEGSTPAALDSLIGKSVEPLIAVFVLPSEAEQAPRQGPDVRKKYMAMFSQELVPAIDEKYRTRTDRMSRATVGAASGGSMALGSAFAFPQLFGKVAAQSPVFIDSAEVVSDWGSIEEHPKVIYQEWGTYHLRSPHEAWDMARNNRAFWSELREQGYRPTGGEVPEGFGWGCWRGHTDKWLTALFPMPSGGSSASTAGN